MLKLLRDGSIVIAQGDTGTISVEIEGETSSSDLGVFQVIDILTHKVVLSKSYNLGENEFLIEFSYEDTLDLELKEYYYDVKIIKGAQFKEEEFITARQIDSYYTGLLHRPRFIVKK